ncbi:MAG: hypothetical protein RR063_12490, partial [Anaerovoracaceae bacterium]
MLLVICPPNELRRCNATAPFSLIMRRRFLAGFLCELQAEYYCLTQVLTQTGKSDCGQGGNNGLDLLVFADFADQKALKALVYQWFELRPDTTDQKV